MVGPAPTRVVDRQRLKLDSACDPVIVQHPRATSITEQLVGVAQVERASDLVAAISECQQRPRPCRRRSRTTASAAVAVDGERLPAQRLDDEVRDDAAVLLVHARPVGVEDARNLDRTPRVRW